MVTAQDEMVAKDWLSKNGNGLLAFAWPSLAALLVQVRAEASQEKDAEILNLEASRAALERHADALREENARLRKRVSTVIAEVHDMDQLGPATDHRFAYVEEQLTKILLSHTQLAKVTE